MSTPPIVLHSHHPVVSEGLMEWLIDAQATIALATTRWVWLVGQRDGVVQVSQHGFDGLESLAWTGTELLVAARPMVWSLRLCAHPSGRGALLLPQVGYVTGGLGIVDLDRSVDGEITFASSLLGCLGTIDHVKNLRPTWAPAGVGEVRPENSASVSGFCFGPANTYVTLAADGLLLSSDDSVRVPSLSFPCAPRTSGDDVLVVEGGVGQITRVDKTADSSDPLIRIPALLTTMTLHEEFAVVGFTRPKHAPDGMTASSDWRNEDGLTLVDLSVGSVIGQMTFEGDAGPVRSVTVVPHSQVDLAVPRDSVAQRTVVLSDSRR